MVGHQLVSDLSVDMPFIGYWNLFFIENPTNTREGKNHSSEILFKFISEQCGANNFIYNPLVNNVADKLDFMVLFVCIILQCFIAIASYNNNNYNLLCSIWVSLL